MAYSNTICHNFKSVIFNSIRKLNYQASHQYKNAAIRQSCFLNSRTFATLSSPVGQNKFFLLQARSYTKPSKTSDFTTKHSTTHIEKSEKKLDVDEEMLRYDYEEFYETEENVEEEESFQSEEPVRLKRGKTGVFDIEDLVALMNEENIRDLCVIKVPEELRYMDYMVIGTGRSTRHISAVAANIRWTDNMKTTYKRKRLDSDPATVKIEGQLSKDWLALDLGNIAVHLFLKRTRELYDLEQLWTCGPEHDDKTLSTADDLSSTPAYTFEEFSFDAELEKLRKLRQDQNKQFKQQAAE